MIGEDRALKGILTAQLEEVTRTAKAWFEASTTARSRAEFDGRGTLRDPAIGSVYVYYDDLGQALYVGQTNRGVKTRSNDDTHCHRKSGWWPKWRTLCFFPLGGEMDRLTLELLLILAYQPTANKKPSAKAIEELFTDRLSGSIHTKISDTDRKEGI